MKKKMAGMGFFWREEKMGGNPVTLSLQELTVYGESVRFGLLSKGYGPCAVYIGGYFAERLVSFFYQKPVKMWQEGDFCTGEELMGLFSDEIGRAMKEIGEYCRLEGEEGRLSFRGVLFVGEEFVAFEKGEGGFLFQERLEGETKMYRVRLPRQRGKDSYGMAYGHLYEEGIFWSMEEEDMVRGSKDILELMEGRQRECIYLLK